MKHNSDLFIKYLDDQLSADQKKEFKLRLTEDQNLQLEFENYAQVYKSIKKTIEVDERYFATLLPNVRERMDKKSQNYFGKLAYILSVLIIGIFIVYFINTNNNKLDKSLISISELLETDENLSSEDLENILDLNRHSHLNDQILEMYFNDNIEMDSTLFDYLESNLAANEISNSFLEDLSENEFNLIYQDLKNEIIGEK
jgi:hypothetical protein